MLDFLIISTRSKQRGVVEIYPKFIVKKSSDLMIRGGDFYAVWLEDCGLWSTNEEDVIRIIDNELDNYARLNKSKFEDHVKVLHMWDSESGMIDMWHKYCQKQLRDNYSPLDEKIIFANQVTTKEDYASKKLSYALDENGSIDAYEELASTLYSEDERHKIEWAIGAVVTGESKNIQKLLTLYGPPGSGKSTVLNIIQLLFDGYYSVFDADTLGSATDMFSLEQFKTNPLVAICHEADLSRIEKNTKLNSLISHERMIVNEKHRSQYSMRFNSFLFIGTNKPVKITDAKSGLIRRLIDAHPTGDKLSMTKYNRLVKQISFEIGAIANHCKHVYLEDPSAYDDYKPVLMMGESNDFYNFVEDSYQIFKKEDGVTLKSAWELYKMYCENARVPYSFSMRVFKSELRNYFKNYEERIKVGEEWVRSYYSGFRKEIFEAPIESEKPRTRKKKDEQLSLIDFKEQPSNLDILCASCTAQYGYETGSGAPMSKWADVTSVLSDLDTHKLHWLKVPENLIVIDFDITDEHGNKSFERNLVEASKWPKTYAELSKSGGGIHLHYIYNGDTSQLSRIYGDSIEIKVFSGNSSLRRMLSKCNSEKISTINSGLPTKGDGKVINFEAIKNEKALRTIIKKNLNKEYHPATKPSVDFIFKALEDAYSSGIKYDVSDLYNVIVAFAASSSNQSDYCLKLIPKMKFKSEEPSDSTLNDEQPIVFYDIEVFPNLFILNWKFLGANRSVTRMITPTSQEVEALLKYRLVGFNCRRYDNHILYGRLVGYTNEQLFNLSQKIINEKLGFFGEAYNISYTDIYDYTSTKQSLKKWEIELGVHHQELGLDWNKPVPEHLWPKVAEYCDNDVLASEAVWNATQGDFRAREILAELAGMSVNETTNKLTERIIFGHDKNPPLNYVDLVEDFPGYEFVKEWNPKTQRFDKFNMYRGVDLGFGGFVYAEPGMYSKVALLDVASMHPNSAITMNIFGEYTKNFADLVRIRVLIKRKKYDEAKKLFGGRLAKYLDDPKLAKDLSYALKIAINSVYGLTSASFKNTFRDPRNENNIVALRGALFMKTLQDEIQSRGFKVAHIKTDSIKIPDATPEIISFCMDFAKRYGYEFEHEATYDRMCLVNDAVYVSRTQDWEKSGDDELIKAKGWSATGTQFKVPYVFKKCFSHEPIVFRDLCEVKEVSKGAIYLNFNEGSYIDEESLRFVGRVGLFTPIKLGCGGGELVKPVKKKDGSISYDSVTGTKGYRWMQADEVRDKDMDNCIDLSYYTKLVDNAIHEIDKYGDYEWFVSDEPYLELPIVDEHPDYNVSNCQIDNPFRHEKPDAN